MAGFRTEWDTAPNPVYDIWTSVNGSEIVPGILSPLIATTMNLFDYRGLRRLSAEYPAGRHVKHFPPPVGNFFGVAGGRLVLNNGYSVAGVSALDPAIAQAILQQFFTGASGGERFIVDATPAELAESYAIWTRLVAEAPAELDRIGERLWAERRSDAAERDLELPLRAAWRRFSDLMEENQVEVINVHYRVSVAAGEWQVRLGGILVAGGVDPSAVVALCSGLGEVESSRPAIALYELARLARSHPEVAAGLTAAAPSDLAGVAATAATGATKGWRAFARAFAAFLDRYGFRTQGEADPTNADWSEQPVFALSQVRAMIAVPDHDGPKAHLRAAAAQRRATERAVRRSLPAELRAPFDDALAKAQDLTRLRERSKATWVLAVRRARAPYLAFARRLRERGVIAKDDDARFLTHDEARRLAAGRQLEGTREAVARRRRQFRRAEDHILPDNWVGEARPMRRRSPTDTTTLTGLGVSIGAGTVRGTARIIPSAEAGLARDIEPGEILVAPFTDVPWTPLFIPAGAVVVETGGLLSHAATVAREFAIPAVVMCKDATRVIRDGDTVEVDGTAGTVRIIRRAGAAVPA